MGGPCEEGPQEGILRRRGALGGWVGSPCSLGICSASVLLATARGAGSGLVWGQCEGGRPSCCGGLAGAEVHSQEGQIWGWPSTMGSSTTNRPWTRVHGGSLWGQAHVRVGTPGAGTCEGGHTWRSPCLEVGPPGGGHTWRTYLEVTLPGGGPTWRPPLSLQGHPG